MKDLKQKLIVKPIPVLVAKDVIEKNHYSKSYQGASILNFGLFVDDKLKGVAVYGKGVNKNAHNIIQGCNKDDFLELTRLWLSDDLPKNSESRFISITIKLIKKHAPHIKFLLSYADPNKGHSGIIYQASNWLYIGEASKSSSMLLLAGQEIHKRTIYGKVSGNVLDKIRKYDPDFKFKKELKKHKYLYLMDKKLKSRLKLKISSFPKKDTKHT